MKFWESSRWICLFFHKWGKWENMGPPKLWGGGGDMPMLKRKTCKRCGAEKEKIGLASEWLPLRSYPSSGEAPKGGE
jgi:hypothetical protein